jgi:hypothetical protein
VNLNGATKGVNLWSKMLGIKSEGISSDDISSNEFFKGMFRNDQVELSAKSAKQ